jgi:hypothetical protein
MNNARRRRCFKLFFGPLSAFVLLAGCAGDTAVTPEKAKPEVPQHAPQTASVPAPAPAPAPPPEPMVNAPAPGAVIGWSTAALNETFGAAGLVRRDLGAEIWQYRTEKCVLLLFLYPKPGQDGSKLEVSHLDVGGESDADACLESVVRHHMRRSTG